MRSLRIGVDIGGTKIEIAAFDADGALVVRRRVPSPADDYDAIVDTVGGLVAEIEAETGERGTVGIGTPGAISPRSGLIKNSNSTIFNGRALGTDLSARLDRDIRIANDADCFASSEARDGAAAGARCTFGAILGTGVGGGIVVDGVPLRGPNAIAGEWGHNPLPWPQSAELPGLQCYCGRYGCIETFLSGPGLERDYAQAAGSAARVPDIVAAAERGETAALSALERYADRLARALAAVINVLDPDIVVLGGGVSNIIWLYEELPRRLPSYVFSESVETIVARAAHGDSSGVRGAAWLWP